MSFSLIGSHFNDRNPSEIWSYFLSPRIIRPAKFWTFCTLYTWIENSIVNLEKLLATPLKAQKKLCERFGDPYGRVEDQCRIWETHPDNLGEFAYMLSCCLFLLFLRKGEGSGDGLVGGGGCVWLITYHSMSIATEQEFCGINCDREVWNLFIIILSWNLWSLSFFCYFLRQHKYIDFILSVMPN